MDAGILGYGLYLPYYRIKTAEIAPVWGKLASDIERSLGISQKSVAAMDEDAVTMAYQASLDALLDAGINPGKIEALMVGSESHPYAVNPTSTILGEFLGIGHSYLATDLEFACKAGTTALISLAAMISSGTFSTAMAVGSDCAQAKPHDILEYTAASGAAAFILGTKHKAIADIVAITSYSSDTPDFWRRDGVRFPSHGGRFTGEPAYFSHVENCGRQLFEKSKLTARDFRFAVFHMPNGKFPKEAAKRLGFTEEQTAASLIVKDIGNPYTASSLIGLAAALDQAQQNDLIFLVSYGSGAGSDGLVLRMTKNAGKKRNGANYQERQYRKKYISYLDYLKFRGKI
ncbi:MAG: hydroxymethylglutaryl-CoA synthase [Candidatus Gottesmanbacteria bacterium GW2011_GWA2_43_14]|uniref:Hydroxymethylglutaryl-CoA synthase n=1 Tax=Candidatus Gottesmanbacteria bacterium GW2011_GWA2_43_14 TaxID=1618443 RepID=A0A0G1GGF0_9BACT|nr:MAG: hydroxymethylglutaryl-CoA synthase [Candidatus Gottesmanbacteria bacterium GW2011_GWA2_43_14]